MFALVQDGSITKTLSGNRGITLGGIQYPRAIYTLWSAAEKEAIGIYEVVFDNTNKKDEAYYTNTNQTFAYADGAVTASFGSPTAPFSGFALLSSFCFFAGNWFVGGLLFSESDTICFLSVSDIFLF